MIISAVVAYVMVTNRAQNSELAENGTSGTNSGSTKGITVYKRVEVQAFVDNYNQYANFILNGSDGNTENISEKYNSNTTYVAEQKAALAGNVTERINYFAHAKELFEAFATAWDNAEPKLSSAHVFKKYREALNFVSRTDYHNQSVGDQEVNLFALVEDCYEYADYVYKQAEGADQ